MGLFDFFRRPPISRPEPSVLLDIPLFPLNTVLFPGGLLPLKVFEQRYLDMAAACMKEGRPFGVCLIDQGTEVAEPGSGATTPHPVGTLADIVAWDMEQLGILQLTVRGGQRFRIIESRSEPNALLRARVRLYPEDEPVPLPPERQRLVPLLQRIVSDQGPERVPEPHAFADAAWVGYRLTEILPVQNLAKQKLLELEDALTRLEILEKFLDQRRLL